MDTNAGNLAALRVQMQEGLYQAIRSETLARTVRLVAVSARRVRLLFPLRRIQGASGRASRLGSRPAMSRQNGGHAAATQFSDSIRTRLGRGSSVPPWFAPASRRDLEDGDVADALADK